MPQLPYHPIEKVLFTVLDPLTEEIEEACTATVDKLTESGEWVIAPPQLVDLVEEGEAEEVLIERIAVLLEIHSSMPPTYLPPEIDRLHFEEVTALMDSVTELSRRMGLVVDVTLDGDQMGPIENGDSESVREILLDEWRKVLEAHDAEERK